MLFNGRNEVIKLCNNYSLMILEAKKMAAEKRGGRGLKILTPKQILQRLPVSLTKVKAGKNSESLFFIPIKTNHKTSIQQHN